MRQVVESGGEAGVAAGVGDRLDGDGERVGCHGVSLGPLLPGVEGVEEPLGLGELEAVEVVEVGARPDRVGVGAQRAGSSGELVEVLLDGCAAGLDFSDGGFGVVDGAPRVGEAVSGAPPAADAGVAFVVCGVPQRGLQALAELLVDLGDLGGVGGPRGVRRGEVGLKRGQLESGSATPVGGLVEVRVQVVSPLEWLGRGAANPPPGALAGFCWSSWFQYLAFSGRRAEALSFVDEKRVELPKPGEPNTWTAWSLLFGFTEGLFVLGDRDEPAGWHDLVVEARATGAVATSYIDGRLLERVAGIAATAAEKWDAAEAHFLLALRQGDELPHQVERLETRRFYAQMLTERVGPGDMARARTLLDEAVEGYTTLRMPRHRDLAQAAVAAIGG